MQKIKKLPDTSTRDFILSKDVPKQVDIITEYGKKLQSTTNIQKGFLTSLSTGTKLMLGFTAAMTAISVVSSIYESIKQKQEEFAQANRDAANAASEESQTISQLLNSYNQLSRSVTDNQGSKENLIAAQNELLSALGVEEAQLEKLIHKYGDLDTAINAISLEQLQENEIDLRAGVATAKQDLLKAGKEGILYKGINAGINEDVHKQIENLNIKGVKLRREQTDYDNVNMTTAFLTTDFDLNTAEGIIAKYEALVAVRQGLYDLNTQQGTIDRFINSDLHNQLTNEIRGLEESYNNYQSLIKNWNALQAEDLIKNKKLPKTQKEFEDFRKSMIKAAEDSNKFIGSQNDIQDSITNALAAMPELEQYFEKLKADAQIIDLSNIAENAQRFSEYYKSMQKAAERFSGVSSLEAAKGYGDSDQKYSHEYRKLEEFVQSNSIDSKSAIDFWNQCLNESKSAEEAMKRYTDQQKLNLAFSDHAAVSINTFSQAVTASASAMEEQAATGIISSASWDTLKASLPGVEAALEHTASGIILNTDKLRELNSEQARSNADKLAEDYQTLSNYYTKESARLSGYQSLLQNRNLTQETKESIEELAASQQATLDVTAEQILKLEFLGSELDNVTSKYNVFKTAMSSSDSGANFEYMTSMKSRIDEMHKKGQYGKDEYRAFVDLFSAEDMNNASINEIKAAYESAYSKYQNLFTSDNAQKNLLNQLTESGYATISETDDGSVVQINDIDAAAEQAGIKVDALKIAIDNLKDSGYYVEIESQTGIEEPEQVLERLNQQLASYQNERASLTFASPDLDRTIQEVQAEIDELEILLYPHVAVADATEEILALQTQIDSLVPNVSSYERIDSLKAQQQTLAEEHGLDLGAVLTVNAEYSKQTLDETTQKIIDIDALLQGEHSLNVDVDDNGKLENLRQQIKDIISQKYTVRFGTFPSTLTFTNSSDAETPQGAPSATGQGVKWQGSAFSRGSWYNGTSGKSLVGELGRELVVRGSRYFTVGDNGAEFVPLRSNDIIFNHRQTEALLENGRINSRGKAYAAGTIDWTIEKEKSLSESLRKKASSTTISYLGLTAAELEHAKAILESTDGIMEQEMMQLQDMAKAAGLSLSDLFQLIQNGGYTESRRSYLAQIIESDKRQLNNYTTAIDQQQKYYESLAGNLTPELREKIEGDSQAIEALADEDDQQVKDALAAYQLLEDYKAGKQEIELKYIEDVKNFHTNNIEYLDQQAKQVQASNALIQAQINYLKESGQIVTAASYQQLIENNKREAAILEQKIAAKQAAMADLMKDEDFDENTSQDYLDIQEEISNLETARIEMNTEREQLQNDLLNLPIENIDSILSIYDSVINSIKQWGAQMEVSGRKVDQQYYQMLINNGMEIIDQYKEQAGLVRDVMDEYEMGSDNWNTLYSKLQSINSEMSSMIENLHKWNEALLQMPLDSVSEYADKLQKAVNAMSDVQSDFDTVISAVTNAVQEEIDLLNEERDAHNENYDTQIDVLKERLELLQKQNEALRVQSAYEQALYDLQTANTQKTERVIRDGQIVYETNADNIRNAEESLQNALANLTQYDLEKEIEGLQDELDMVNDRYEEQIESLEKISEKWSEISEKISTAKDEALAAEILGTGWKESITGGNDDALYSMFSGMYQKLSDQISQYEEQITSTENIYTLLEDYIAAYKEGTISYEQAVQGVNSLLAQLNQSMSTMSNLDNVFKFLATATGADANAESILTSVQDALHQTGTELIASLEQYNENAALISEYTTSWQQLTENVNDIKDILEDVRDNLEDALYEITNIRNDRDDDDDDDDDTGKSSGSTSNVITAGVDHSNYGPSFGTSSPQYAAGIENGLVGSSQASRREYLLRLFSTQKIPDSAHAVPVIAHEGEAILNRQQQSMLLENLASAWNYTPAFGVPDYAAVSSAGGVSHTSSFSFGDIRIERCDNPDQLAEGILKGGLKSAIMQQIGKR